VFLLQFYADAAQFEHEITHTVYRTRKELQGAEEHHVDLAELTRVLQASMRLT
jgi:hypothetical protein